MLDCAPLCMEPLVLKNTICQEIEQTVRVEMCFILKQEGDLLVGMKGGTPIYISLRKARVYSQVLEENRLICVNDLNKERDYTK